MTASHPDSQMEMNPVDRWAALQIIKKWRKTLADSPNELTDPRLNQAGAEGWKVPDLDLGSDRAAQRQQFEGTSRPHLEDVICALAAEAGPISPAGSASDAATAGGGSRKKMLS